MKRVRLTQLGLRLRASRDFGVVFFALSCAAPCSAADDTFLEEVVVYAQKRPESAQSVPIALTAYTDELIRETGMLTLERLTNLSPSVSFDTAQSWQNSSLKIRGIGTIGNTRSFEGAVGVFIDDVYRSRSGMALSDLVDIGRLEVLRGPQSTLFGKNTVAGAIALRSNRPEFDSRGGYGELRFGDQGFRYVAAGLNAPFSERSALRVAGVFHQRDGFFTSPDTGDEYDAVDRYAVKGQWRMRPTDTWEIHVIADMAESDAPCCWGSAQVVNGPTSLLIDTYSQLNGLTFVPAPASERQRSHSLNERPRERVEDAGLSASVVWHANDRWQVKSITAARQWQHSQINADADFVPADLFILNEPSDIDSFSQEFNVRFAGDRFDLLLGLYYATEDYASERSAATGADADNYVNALISGSFGAVACLPPVVATDCLFPTGVAALLPDGEFTRESYSQDTRGYAVYAHATTDLSPALTLVTGMRYDHIKKDGGVQNLFWYDSAIARAALADAGIPDDGTARNGLDLIGTLNSPSFTDATRNAELTGTVQLQYQWNDKGMIYGGYHRGFKAGGVNLFREGAITNSTYAPEIADSVEAGIKVDYLGNRARTNIAVFHTRFSDLQINFFTGLEFRTENTGEASSRGLEIENTFRVTDNLRAEFSATYLRSQFDQISNPFLAYLVNRDTPRAPLWSSVGGLRYDWNLANDWSIFVRGLGSYSGSHYVGADVPDEPKAGSYIITDASVGIAGPDQRWEATLWCANCTDESYRTIYFNSTFQPGSYSVYLNDPRRVGVALRMQF